MSITCKICNLTFPKIIPWQHLKLHNITSKDYKKIHGSLYSEETLAKHSAKIPYNKGKKVTDSETLIKIANGIAIREEKYKSGELIRLSNSFSNHTKQLLSDKQIEYSKNNPKEMSKRAKKAAKTKKDRNISGPMKGKQHSIETKQKLSVISQNTNYNKTTQSNKQISEKITELNLTLLSEIFDKNLKLQCNSCQSFFSFTKQYFTPSKVKTTICPVCYPRNIKKSKSESEIYEYVQSLIPSAISSYRTHYHGKEIDIFIPELNLGIEFNGLYWHSESTLVSNGKSPTSDFEKQKYFFEQGIRIIQIFEDEWENKQLIVKSRLKCILGKISNVIYARKCKIMEISSKQSSQFCNDNHLQGSGRSNIRLGLFYNERLVSVMTFTNNNISRKLSNVWEINRFSSLLDIIVIGSADKLFKHFLKMIDSEMVISYSDNRWSNGNLYRQLSFEKVGQESPNYWYIKSNIIKRIHRYSLRKNKDDDQKLTEYENRLKQGYIRVWDCGHSKWQWKK